MDLHEVLAKAIAGAAIGFIGGGILGVIGNMQQINRYQFLVEIIGEAAARQIADRDQLLQNLIQVRSNVKSDASRELFSTAVADISQAVRFYEEVHRGLKSLTYATPGFFNTRANKVYQSVFRLRQQMMVDWAGNRMKQEGISGNLDEISTLIDALEHNLRIDVSNYGEKVAREQIMGLRSLKIDTSNVVNHFPSRVEELKREQEIDQVLGSIVPPHLVLRGVEAVEAPAPQTFATPAPAAKKKKKPKTSPRSS